MLALPIGAELQIVQQIVVHVDKKSLKLLAHALTSYHLDKIGCSDFLNV